MTAALPARAPRFSWFCVFSHLYAIGYGTTFLLVSLLTAQGLARPDLAAGQILSVAAIATLAAVLISGHVLEAIGAVWTESLSGLMLAAGTGLFAVGWGQQGAYAAGVLLGAGWGLHYTVGPVLVAQMLGATPRRSRAFAVFSGAMMMGIGVGPLLGWGTRALGQPMAVAFGLSAIACLAGAVLALLPLVGLDRLGPAPQARLSLSAMRRVVTSPALVPTVMVGLGGCIFSGLSTFQTSFAASRGLDFGAYFAGFMAGAIPARLFFAGLVVGREPRRTALVLILLTACAIAAMLWLVQEPIGYFLASLLFGGSYGLTYSVINTQAANESWPRDLPQTLLLFSFAYFAGVFGYPLLGGWLVETAGPSAMVGSTLAIALLNASLPALWLMWRPVRAAPPGLAPGR